MLAPGQKKTHRAYVWTYCTTPYTAVKAVVYDFSPSRAGEHARNFLGSWNGKLVCDDFAGYKAGFEKGMTEIGCMAHARRKLFELHMVNKSQLAEKALHSIGGLYEVERQAHDMSVEDRWRIRQEKAAPLAKALHNWMLTQRDLVPNGSATAKALDYSLKRWVELTSYLDDGLCQSTIIQSRTRSDRGHLGAPTGCRRVATQRKTGCGDHELDPVSAAEWP